MDFTNDDVNKQGLVRRACTCVFSSFCHLQKKVKAAWTCLFCDKSKNHKVLVRKIASH